MGLFEKLRRRGFWTYFLVVALLVFVLLTGFEILLQLLYEQPWELNALDVVWELGTNIAISLLSAGVAWQVNGKPLINRPDTIKLDLDK